MKVDFLSVLITVLSLVVLAVPGFILGKLKMLPQKASEAFSTLALYVCQTALVFMGFQKAEYDPKIGKNMLIVFVLAVVIHFIMIGIMHLFVRNKSKQAKQNVVRYAGVFGNCGYMGMPFLQSLFNNSGEVLIYCAVVLTVFNILNWTFGVYIISGDKKEVSFKKILFNPVIICVVLGFLVFMLAKKPIVDIIPGDNSNMLDFIITKLVSSINFLGDMVTPLSMIVIGMRLANVNFKQLFMDKWAYLVCFFKLIVMSLITILIVSFLPIDNVIKVTLFFLLSMPSATSTAMYAIKFNGEGDSASIIVLLTTMMSIVIIPLMFLVLNGVFGVSV